MKKLKVKYIFYALLLVLAVAAVVYSSIALLVDGAPLVKSTREYLKNGNALYRDSLYNNAIEPYRRAVDREPENSLANYNGATNLLMKNYKDIKDNVAEPEVVANVYKDANVQLLNAAGHETDKEGLASIYHNSGLIYHLNDSLEMAAEAYKESLRNNPKDDETRYNLAVVLHLLKQNQNQQNQQNQQEQQDQQEQKQEEQQDKQQQQQQNEQQNQQQKQENQQTQNQQEQAAREEEEMSKENAERLLNAAMQDEKGVLEKVKREENRSSKRSLEKNW